MSLKSFIKSMLPPFALRLYNRVVSRTIIRRKLGEWFDVDWNRRAKAADTNDWLRTYDASWENWEQQDLAPQDVKRLRELVKPCHSLLDAGCGDGFLLEALRDRADALTGVDLSGVGLQRARQRLGDGVMLVQSFLEALPFADNAFDTVVTTHTVEHVSDLEAAISELKRVTARHLIILVPCQEETLYTEDYHIQYFPEEKALLDAVGIAGASCERYTIPPGVCAYSGDVLLLSASIG